MVARDLNHMRAHAIERIEAADWPPVMIRSESLLEVHTRCVSMILIFEIDELCDTAAVGQCPHFRLGFPFPSPGCID